MKTFLTVVILGSIAVGVLAGCSGGSSEDPSAANPPMHNDKTKPASSTNPGTAATAKTAQ
jgi:hypothetical protein